MLYVTEHAIVGVGFPLDRQTSCLLGCGRHWRTTFNCGIIGHMDGEMEGRGAGPLRSLGAVAALLFAVAVFAYWLYFTIRALRWAETDPQGWVSSIPPHVFILLPWVVSGASALLLRRHHRFATTAALTASILLLGGIICFIIAVAMEKDPDADQGSSRALIHPAKRTAH